MGTAKCCLGHCTVLEHGRPRHHSAVPICFQQNLVCQNLKSCSLKGLSLVMTYCISPGACLQLPGQMIGIKYCADGQEEPTQTAKRLFAIASSPYDSRRDSSLLDASMIEVSPGICFFSFPYLVLSYNKEVIFIYS